MKIGFDFRMGGSINAGIGRYSFEVLSKLLQEVNKAGLAEIYQFVVFYHEQNNDPTDLKTLRELGAELVPANYRHYSVGEQLQFPRLLGKYNLDLVHFPNFNVPIFYRRPYVVTIHDVVHHKISGHKKSRYHKFLAYKYIINRAVVRAEKVITVTETAKQEIIELLHVPSEKIVVTYEAPTRNNEVVADFDELSKQFLLHRPYLLFVGTLEKKKNLVNLAKGFDRLLSRYKYELDLVIAGRVDPHHPEVKEQMLAIKHCDNLVFTGFISNAEQAALYQNAFAFITASLHEGFGLPGLEAMDYGLPVLAANTPVFNEVYDNAAIYFDGTNPEDIADKIKILVTDQPFYESMQQKSLERTAQFDWKKTARQTFRIYNQVLSKYNRSEDEHLEPEIE